MGRFGNIQAGQGTRFRGSRASERPADGFRSSDFRGLTTGPDLTLDYDPNVTVGVDGSAEILRELSPFRLQVEPPMVYGNISVDESRPDYAGILAAGHKSAPSAFGAARNRVSQTIPGGQFTALGSAEEFVAQGALYAQSGASRSEVRKVGDTRNALRTGEPSIADVYSAVDVTMQLKGILSTPPLILLINPQSLSITYTKLQQFSDRTRFGFVFQAWGEEQPKISISARCGAFISGERGVQHASRRDSAAWQNLVSAFHLYRHNGYIYDTLGKSNAHRFVGALSIHYDGWIYYGNMESFSYTLDEGNQQGGVAFEMEFTVNAMVDTSKSGGAVSPLQSPLPSRSDPRYYGQENRAIASQGDLSVGGPQGVVVGGEQSAFVVTPVTLPSADTGVAGRVVPFRQGAR